MTKHKTVGLAVLSAAVLRLGLSTGGRGARQWIVPDHFRNLQRVLRDWGAIHPFFARSEPELCPILSIAISVDKKLASLAA